MTFYLYDYQTFERVFVMQQRLDVSEFVQIERESLQFQVSGLLSAGTITRWCAARLGSTVQSRPSPS